MRKTIEDLLISGQFEKANVELASFLEDLIVKSEKKEISNYDLVRSIQPIYIEMKPILRDGLNENLDEALFVLWEMHDIAENDFKGREEKLIEAKGLLDSWKRFESEPTLP